MTHDDNNAALEKTLPGHCYLDDAFFQRERGGIFAAEWFCVARAPEFDKVGSYRLIELAGESVIVLRSSDTGFHAFHNLCRHRGSQLVPATDDAPAGGHFRGAIRCPYHSWTYGLDGHLQHTPHLDIDKSGLNLHPVPLAQWGGFIFLRLSSPADNTHHGKSPGEIPAPAANSSLDESLGEISARVQRYPLAGLRVGHSISYSVAANWKVVLENYNECYHCAGVHPELCAVVPAFRRNGGSGLDWDRGVPHRDGANTFTRSGTTNRPPFPGLNEDERNRHKGELIYPNLMISMAMDHVAAFTLLPRAVDRTDIVCDFLFHPDAITADDFDPSDAVEFWDITNRQDWAICENVQRGMGSSRFHYGYYAPMEDLSLDIRNYILARIPDACASVEKNRG